MPRNLTTRQRKFVAAVAAGKTQTEAYELAGYAANGKRRTTVRNARQLAQNGEVRAAVEAMRLQLLPDPGDVRAIRAHAMAVIVGLSLNAQDEKVRMRSAEWLHEETGRQIAEQERLEGLRVVPAANSPEAILEELRELYEKALPEAAREPEPLVVEAAPGEE